MLNELLEITEREALRLFEKGKVVYICVDNNTPDSSFNIFTLKKGIADASLNMYRNNGCSFQEQLKFIRLCQADPVRFLTLYSEEQLILPLEQAVNTDIKININGFDINLCGNATNFNARISKQEAERIVKLDIPAPFEIMCKEYGDDDDWCGVTRDELNENGEFDDDFQTFECWFY